MRKLLLALAAVVAVMSVGVASAATSVVTVTPANMQGWHFFDDTTNGPGTGQMVFGPAGQPLGSGSAQLTALLPTDRQALGTGAYTDTRLANISQLGYWSYQTGPTLAISLQFDVRYRPTDTAYGGRLVYEPYQSVGAVPAGWTSWDTLAGRWWASKTNAAGSNGLCSQSSPCTWAQVRSNWPDAQIWGRLLFKAGGAWSGFVGNVDALTVGVSGQATTYDFEPTIGPPTSKKQCKHGGWRRFNNPAFESERDCKNFVKQQKKNAKDDQDHDHGHDDDNDEDDD